MIVEKIPDWLTKYFDKIKELRNLYPPENLPNHALINEYLSGQGIMPHTDGPLFYPIITTINCQSHTVLEFTKKDSDVCFKILLEPRSLLILKDELYIDYLHAISEIKCDIINNEIVNLENCCKKYQTDEVLARDTRISVTIRNVPKVAKIKLWK